MVALEIVDVSRSFGRGDKAVQALKNVDLTLEPGETVGLLGVNGAGKTTLLKVISTLLLPTSGTVRVAGVDVVKQTREARRQLSVVLGGERGFYGRLSARDNIRYFGILSGLSHRAAAARGEQVLAQVGLTEVADRAVETYSKGMKQRLHIASGLLTTPKLLMLDEPTVGLDPIEAEHVREAVAQLRDSGVTILLTSHYMVDIERLARRVVILQAGQLTHDLPLERLLEQATSAAEVNVSGAGVPPLTNGEVMDGVRVVRSGPLDGGWNVTFEVRDWSPASLRALADLWPQAEVGDVRVLPANLERVFAQLTR
ncbi:ABC transporter ATP-binding protein [Hamadaea tsunoensis]|uniref:ABC transporter ATP-binding protein n=1 Tax=Hamadaea tsunoensis TaxID=53368 RepID=UPI000406B01E|nr:ABC transporter ATP-binding protein [Hamadaea tsunoensis]